MWILLFGLTALVLVLPLLPAIAEWRRPSDIAPLHIDAEDALDPTWTARAAAQRLFAVIASGGTSFDGQPLAFLPRSGAWPFDDAENLNRVSQRAWHAAGDALLPPGMHFAAEVFAPGSLQTAPGELHGALWAGRQLRLARASTVLRWAHASGIDAEADCHFVGRVTADESIRLASGCRFGLLQAPTIGIAADASDPLSMPLSTTIDGLPADVAVDEAAGRGVCDSIDLGAQRAWRGDLVCRGDLVIGRGCRSVGNVKARGTLAVDPFAWIDGALVAEGSITLGEGCRVTGSVVSETAIVIGPGCRIGLPGRPATVTAPRIDVATGVIVHGTLWAEDEGRVQHVARVADETAAEVAVVAPTPADVPEQLAA